MEFFVREGRFWLPRQRERGVHGSVTYQEDGITLQLVSCLRGPISLPGGLWGGSPTFATEPVIHGYLYDGGHVTLYQARGIAQPVANIQETWRAQFLFIGDLINNFRFIRAQIEFDYLMSWTQPPGIIENEIGRDDVTVDTRTADLDQAIVGGSTKVSLRTGAAGRWDHASIHLDQWSTLEVTTAARDAKTITAVLDDWVRPLQDLLVVSLGRPIRIERLAVRARGQSSPSPLLEVFCPLVQPRLRLPPSVIDVENYTAPTLLTYRTSPVPFAKLIPTWFVLRENLSDVITDLCGPYYAPFIYSGHRYSSIFQSAEALAHALCDRKQKTRREHRARVDAVAHALAKADLVSDHLDWASNVLLSRNDKPLRDLIDELIIKTGPMGKQLMRMAPRLPDEAATARARVSHPGSGGPGILRRYWLGEALIWVIRAHIIGQLGIPIEHLSKQVIRMTAFKDVLSGLKAGDASRGPFTTPGYFHGNCPVNHRTEAAAARCKNR